MPSDRMGRFNEEMAKKLVLAWDPDFTRLTPSERVRLEEAEEEIARGETFPDSAVDWD